MICSYKWCTAAGVLVSVAIGCAPLGAWAQARKRAEPKPIDLKAHVRRTSRELGTREVRIDKSDAFYFLNGRYFRVPYTIRREGYALHLNGIETFRAPPAPQWYEPNPPPLPKEISAKSSWADVDTIQVGNDTWKSLYIRWLRSNFAPDDMIAGVTAGLKRLPFVEKVEWVPTPEYGKGLGFLRITSKRGDVRELFTNWWDPGKKGKDKELPPKVLDYRLRIYDYSPYRTEEIRKNLDARIATREKLLKGGELAFISDAAGWHFRIRRDDRRWNNIVYIVAILNSDASKKLKAQEVYRQIAGPFPFKPDVHPRGPYWELIKELVRNFKPDAQLDARVAVLKKRFKLPDWKPPPEPQAFKLPPALKDDPRATPQGTVREALKALETRQYQQYIDRYGINRGRKQTGQELAKQKALPYVIMALRNVQGKKPVIGDIDDDVAFFPTDAALLKKIPKDQRGKFYERLPLRRIGGLWKIGY